jgi:hypothetical protein
LRSPADSTGSSPRRVKFLRVESRRVLRNDGADSGQNNLGQTLDLDPGVLLSDFRVVRIGTFRVSMPQQIMTRECRGQDTSAPRAPLGWLALFALGPHHTTAQIEIRSTIFRARSRLRRAVVGRGGSACRTDNILAPAMRFPR